MSNLTKSYLTHLIRWLGTFSVQECHLPNFFLKKTIGNLPILMKLTHKFDEKN